MGAALGALIARPALQRRHACVLWMGLWSHRRAEGRVHSILSHRGPTHVQEHIRGLIAKLKALRVSLAGTVLARFDAGGSLMKVFARRVIPRLAEEALGARIVMFEACLLGLAPCELPPCPRLKDHGRPLGARISKGVLVSALAGPEGVR